MNPVKKAALKAASSILTNVKKYYKIYRGLLRVANPYLKPIYGGLDRKIMVLDREIPVRVFLPKKDGLAKAIIFYHGGGWVTGDIDTYTKICAYMANQTKHTVVSVNYRLAPEYPFPAGLEDCYYVTREIFKDPCLINCALEDITLAGDSAGGNLAAVVSLMARDRGEFTPRRQILIYPATYYDHSEKSPFPSVQEYGHSFLLTAEKIQNYMDLYIRDAADKYNPYVAPILAEDLSQQPETLIITAEYDPLRDEAEAYGKKLKEFGNDASLCRIEEAVHGFLAFSKKSRSVIKCYEIIHNFLYDDSAGEESLL
jgi:acetyl esterase/lipase